MISPKLKEMLRFAWSGSRHKRILLDLVVLGVILQLGMMALPRLKVFDNFLTMVWTVAEPAIGLTTLLVVIAVFFWELEQDWENSLPKILTANFKYDDKLVMKCEGAFLAGEADIRQWGQQIGRQMAGGGDLYFLPGIEQSPPTTDKLDENNPHEVHKKRYEVTFTLTKLPANLKAPFEKNQYLLRRPPKFENEWEMFPENSDDDQVGITTPGQANN